jgi:SNF2 family DNA or RNA helicase
MLLQLNQDKTKVLFIHEDGKEYKFLANFPAFLKSFHDPYYWAPAKPQIIYNIYHRLRKAKRTLKVEQAVLDLVNQPFALKQIPADFKFHTKPMDFQEISLRYLYTVGGGGLLLDPGMGKSKVILDFIVLMKFTKCIIVCPKPLLFVWEDEIAIHRPELTYHTVRTTDWAAEREGILKANVTIINYNKAVAFSEALQGMGYQFIHLDEFLIKDPSTSRTKDITELSYSIPHKAGGSGTLINNSVQDVFAPVRYLEPSLVSRSSAKFLNHFGVKKKSQALIVLWHSNTSLKPSQSWSHVVSS